MLNHSFEAATDLKESYWDDSFWEAESDKRSYILMERMSSNLADHIATVKLGGETSKTNMPFSNPVAIDIMLQVARAVWHMHSRNIVLNNFNMKNILVRPLRENEVPELCAEGFLQVKVGDFGVAEENIISSNQEPFFNERQRYPGEKDPRKDSFGFGIMCAEV